MSTANTSSSVIAWGGKNVEDGTGSISFADVMSEDLAQNLQLKYALFFSNSHVPICYHFLRFLSREELSQWPELNLTNEEMAEACGPPVQDTVSDEMLAQLLQLQFDQEYDRALGKEEAKYNGSSKGNPFVSVVSEPT